MTILALILAGYAVVCILVFLFQSRLVYFPERELAATPAEIGLDFRDVSFRSDDGVDLHGWFVPAADDAPVLLFCHGNAGNISDRLGLIQVFHDVGLSVFIFDYRGYGRSEGTPSEDGTYRDATAAWRHLVAAEGIPPERIVVGGHSIGGAIAIELASRVAPSALIVDSSFTSAVDLGARVYWWLPVRWLARIRYDSASRVGALSFPKLFIHSPDDTVVPISMGRQLFGAAADPKEFLEIRGGHHDGFAVSGPTYRNGIAEFLDGLAVSKP